MAIYLYLTVIHGYNNDNCITMIQLLQVSPIATLSIKESDATLLQVCWEALVQSDSHISYYLIRACNLNSSAESSVVLVNQNHN